LNQTTTQFPAVSSLERPVQFLKGVGPGRAPLLQKLGLLTARDVLYHAPHRYEDASTITRIAALATGMDATIVGRVVSSGVLPTRRGLRIFQAVVRDATGMVECAWPGQPYLERVIHKGDLLLLSGPVKFYHGRQLVPREFTVIAGEGETAAEEGGILFPVYPATEGLTHRQVRKLVHDNLDDLLRRVREEEDGIPPDVLSRVDVEPLWKALDHVHRPASLAEAEQGRRRLAFEELFYLQLLHALARHRAVASRPGIAFERRDFLVKPFHQRLPFALTGAQKKVLKEIGQDMAAPRRMNRLLQGDVGSGKTVVALFAMLRAVENGYQAALMAPTEILAEQHARTLVRLLEGLPVGVTLLTGRMGAKQRREAGFRIASGGAGIAVGTHALIQESVEFDRLGLVVVDEQHRFGVRQRLALAEMGTRADMLVMSATPIPRSLALTLYGDLDVSVLDELPPGRTPIATKVYKDSARGKAYEVIRRELLAGRQAYVVLPLVEESEKLADLKAATKERDRLAAEVFPDVSIGLVHGRQALAERNAEMERFRGGETRILVATTVIEVGVDVPNATVMLIEHAERFGLSQLHQLRGRVGRGAAKSHCLLITGTSGAEWGPVARKRLQVMEDTTDGFRIAEADLELRGPGEFLGTRQSGMPDFAVAELARDQNVLKEAREEAFALVEDDPDLAKAGNAALRELMHNRWRGRLSLARVG
jgi:ATP-dependent DNA helicase RecG